MNKRLIELFDIIRSLNPDRVQSIESELLELAKCEPPSVFEDAIRFVNQIIASYKHSPIKQAQQQLFTQYFNLVEKHERIKLISGDEERSAKNRIETTQAFALVPQQDYDSLEWFQRLASIQISSPLSAAIDAAQRRNILQNTVFETLFRFIQTLDRQRAFQWQLSLCCSKDELIDPDIARDLLRAWQVESELPKNVLRQVLDWSNNEQQHRHWPKIIQEADRLLRRHSLTAWKHKMPLGSAHMETLKGMTPFKDEVSLLSWVHQSLNALGDSVDHFIRLAEKHHRVCPDKWRRFLLHRELEMVYELIDPFLLLSDLLFNSPDAASTLAYAIFAIHPERKEQWQEELAVNCKRIIRQAFLKDLKQGRKPLATISRFCLGDKEFTTEIHQQLDGVTEDFSSLEQREHIEGRLAIIYSSYLFQIMLQKEVIRRYHRMMQLLHHDNLQRLFGPSSSFARIEKQLGTTLLELSTIASESRKYLHIRQRLEKENEEIIAAELAFIKHIRKLRSQRIRGLLAL